MSKQSDLVNIAQGDTITVDHANGRVGIGTSSPSRTLTLSGGAGSVNLALQDANTGSSATDGFQLQLASNGDAYLWNYENAVQVFGTNNTERMRIDSAGRVTMPYQPSFRAYNFVPISASTGIIVWQTTAHNVGNHYNTSNGAFTAPVNGTYHFAGNILMSANSSTSYIRVLFRINGAASTTLTDSLTGGVAGAFTNYSYHAIQIAQSFYLSAGDTVQMSNDSPNSSTWSGGRYGSFSGFLVG